MMEEQATRLAEIMIEAMKNKDDTDKKAELQKEVQTMCEAFPVPEKFM
jgi:glycine/serine hydroxymethyltransferase